MPLNYIKPSKPRFYRVVTFHCPQCGTNFIWDLRVKRGKRKFSHFQRYWAAQCPVCKNEVLTKKYKLISFDDVNKIGL